MSHTQLMVATSQNSSAMNGGRPRSPVAAVQVPARPARPKAIAKVFIGTRVGVAGPAERAVALPELVMNTASIM
jgi:hypothetical protein